MTSNKRDPIVTSRPIGEAAAQPDGLTARGPANAPIVPVSRAAGDAQSKHKEKAAWAVTEAGLELQYVINGLPIDCLIEKERLLATLPGTPISMWAAHLAEKTWLSDPEGLIKAIAEALLRHYPDQTAVDLENTREYALQAWDRTHQRRRDAKAANFADGGEATYRVGWPPPQQRWVAPIVARIAQALATHGVDPAAHSGGLYVNERLVQLAMAGATDERLATVAGELKNDHILYDEEPEEDLPPGAEDYIE